MSQEFLNRSDIVTAFEQVRCKGMPERVAGGAFRQTRLGDGGPDGFLNRRVVTVVGGCTVHAAVSRLGEPGQDGRALWGAVRMWVARLCAARTGKQHRPSDLHIPIRPVRTRHRFPRGNRAGENRDRYPCGEVDTLRPSGSHLA